jgi:NOL1/NOP2/fmu family ribosome biogenesis protein
MIEDVFELLKKQFGFEPDFKLKGMGKRKIYAFKSCELDIEAIHSGIYFGKLEKDGLRLSIEGSYLVGRKAKKGVVEVSEEEAIKWMRGEDIEYDVKGYVILKWKGYFLGCGRGDGKKIRNFVPKDRRLAKFEINQSY